MTHALHTPNLRRDYIRHVVGKTQGKINSAHIYLGALLDAQNSSDSDACKWPNKFCSKIFTTNFDPLLQRSLQLVNRLYWMIDQLSDSEVLTDEELDFIQLIYAYGNTFRNQMANTGTELGDRTTKHAQALKPFLEAHGIIVIGYSGWDDCCMNALKLCNQFGNNLYWCDIHSAEDAPKKLRRETIDFLEDHSNSAFYIPIKGADQLMQELHYELGLGTVPGFLINPVTSVISQLENLYLQHADLDITPSNPDELDNRSSMTDEKLSDVIRRTLDTLNDANKKFTASIDEPSGDNQTPSNISHLTNVAYSDFSKNEYEKAIENLSLIIDMPGVPVEKKPMHCAIVASHTACSPRHSWKTKYRTIQPSSRRQACRRNKKKRH